MPALPPAYRAIILDQQEQLQRLVRSAGIAPVRALYDRMLADVTRRIGATPAGTFTHQQLTGLLAQIKLGLARLQAPLGEAVEGGATAVGVHAARTLLQDAAKLEKHFSGAVISLPLLESARLRGLVDRQVSSLMRVHATSMARFGAQLVGRMEEEIGASIAAGDPQTRTIDRIMEVGGLQWHRAERIVRTELAFSAGRSARMAADEQAEELDGDMWSRWTEHVTDEGTPLDDRVGVDSEAMHGQVAPPGEPFTQPPTNRRGELVSDSLVGREWTSPPNRPNDRAVLVPWRASWGVPGWRWEGGRRVPVTEAAAQRTNAAWMRSRGSPAEISSDDQEEIPPPTGIGFQSPTVEEAPEAAGGEDEISPPAGPPPIGFVSPTLPPDGIPEIPAGEIPRHGDLTDPAHTPAADPQAIADHGWYEPAGYEADLERAARAYEEVADGLEHPVRVGVTPRRNLVVSDAEDAARLNAAADLDERIPVRWHRADGVPEGHVPKAGDDGEDPGLGIRIGVGHRIAGGGEDVALTAPLIPRSGYSEARAEEADWEIKLRMAKELSAREEAARLEAEASRPRGTTHIWQPGDDQRTRQVVFLAEKRRTQEEWYQHDLEQARQLAEREERMRTYGQPRTEAERERNLELRRKAEEDAARRRAERAEQDRQMGRAEPAAPSQPRPGIFARIAKAFEEENPLEILERERRKRAVPAAAVRQPGALRRAGGKLVAFGRKLVGR